MKIKFTLILIILSLVRISWSQDCPTPGTDSSCDPAIAFPLGVGYNPPMTEIGGTSKMTLNWALETNDMDIGCLGAPAGSFVIQFSLPNTYEYNGDATGAGFTSSYDGGLNTLTMTNAGTASGASGTICYTVTALTNTGGLEDLTSINMFTLAQFLGGCPAAFGNITSNDALQDGIIVTEVTPVELIYFNAVKKGELAELTWSTATEFNNDYFDVQWSKDGINFVSLTQIPGSGTSAQQQKYEYIHNRPIKGINYYRLQQIDYDDKSEYSPIRSLNFSDRGLSTKFEMGHFPNPVSHNLSITSNADLENHTIVMYNTSGKMTYQGDYNSGMVISMDTYNAGIYMVQTIDANGYIVNTERIIKCR